MNSKYINVMLVAAISSMIAIPSYARGGFGGGGHSFGSFGGGRSFGSFGGGDRSFGGGDRSFGGDSFGGDRSFGGGDRSFGGSSWGSGDRSAGSWGSFDRGGSSSFSGRPENNGVWNRPSSGWGNQGFGNHGDMPISSRPNMPDHLPTDGGFGGISGLQNRTPHNINQNNLNDQGNKIRNSFNNDTFNKTNVNNVNVNRGYGGYGGYGYHGYHPYDNGYVHGWAASNAYHGYWGYPGAWGCPGWSEATMWTCMGLSSLTAFLGLGMMGAELASSKNNNNANTNTIIYPVSNVTYQGDTVYVNGSPSGTPAQYYSQAQQLASQGISSDPNSYPPVAPDLTGSTVTATASTSAQGKWAPLGVFSLAEPGQTQSNMLIQLAINPQGQVRGNYMNQLTNEKSQIYGQLDKKTQRISWTIGENNTTVFDTSLAALTKDDSQILVHYGPNNTQNMALIRLQQPANNNTTASTPPSS
ncbi:MAG: hypothetical protein K2X77_19320 [Candidatus Obscuribacterales bacterium]|jgi:hypothetical protein|nr:hypothetical protein [Candidatus Obscuribacterales bacterium]